MADVIQEVLQLVGEILDMIQAEESAGAFEGVGGPENRIYDLQVGRVGFKGGQAGSIGF